MKKTCIILFGVGIQIALIEIFVMATRLINLPINENEIPIARYFFTISMVLSIISIIFCIINMITKANVKPTLIIGVIFHITSFNVPAVISTFMALKKDKEIEIDQRIDDDGNIVYQPKKKISPKIELTSGNLILLIVSIGITLTYLILYGFLLFYLFLSAEETLRTSGLAGIILAFFYIIIGIFLLVPPILWIYNLILTIMALALKKRFVYKILQPLGFFSLTITNSIACIRILNKDTINRANDAGLIS